MSKTKEINRILQQLKEFGVHGQSTILHDLSVDIDCSVRLHRMCTMIPVQFNRVNGVFNCSYTLVSSFKKAPRYVQGDFRCHDTPNMRSLHGVEQWIPNIKVNGVFMCDQTHILGLALIEGISYVGVWDECALQGMGDWVGFDVSHHDPFLFQEQLLEHGLTEQAQL